VGPIEFWPATGDQLDTRVTARAVRDHLSAYFACYVTERGEPVRVTVTTVGSPGFRALTADEHTLLRRAVDSLLFSVITNGTRWSVVRDDRSSGPPTSERYQLVHQNFRPGRESLAVESGPNLHGGLSLATVRFQRPWCVGGWLANPDELLVAALGELLTTPGHASLRERLFRSLEWFRLAHTGSDDVSVLSKAVMMATAFEVLVQAPRHGKTFAIAQALDARCATPSHSRQPTTIGRQSVDLSPVGRWGAHFYDLRSRIVHGDEVPLDAMLLHSTNWLTHLIVADLVMRELIVRELHAAGLIATSAHDGAQLPAQAFPNVTAADMESTLSQLFLQTRFGFRSIHQRLGWLPTPSASHGGSDV
jgi:hypothetical protein